MHRPALVISILLAAVAALALPAQGQARTVFIESPSGNIACQLDSRWGALCTVFSDRRQAEVRQNGRVSVFDQESDPPSDGVRVLGYGKSLRVRRVRCTSRRTGMRCVHRPSGHGYAAARGRVRTF
jgi:hypothetical protein